MERAIGAAGRCRNDKEGMCMGLRKRSAGLLATVVVGAAAIAPVVTEAGTAMAAQAVTSSCGSYVVASVPLTDNNTNVSSWDYGYVQLWYSSCTQSNWARTVSNISPTFQNLSEVDRSDGAKAWTSYDTTSGVAMAGGSYPVCGWSAYVTCSPTLYSPVLKADAWGRVYVHGDVLYGETGYY
jgi:hypothetical protein